MSPKNSDTAPMIDKSLTFEAISEKISSIVLTPKLAMGWLGGFALAFGLFNLFAVSVAWLLFRGVGIWGINIPVGWGFDIINFVWWIGIGHAGTLISAILLLFRQTWRTSINRFAEAMTLFAVLCAVQYPLLHMGRPWLFYWTIPLPNVMQLWPQFRSPLMWDVFALNTYASVSLVFWFIGLIPDLATLRDRTQSKLLRVIYGMLALGWRGSAIHWHRYETAYLLLAGLATPLVLSVHTIVSFDFAVSVIPGWHSTIFPPYFVAGAIYAGFAMVLMLLIPVRSFYGLKGYITPRHLDNMAKVMLTSGLVVGYGYAMESFTAWYSASSIEQFAIITNRLKGPYAPLYYALLVSNIVIPQALWSRRIRQSTTALFLISVVISIGMWLERFVIVVMSLHRDFLPSSWAMYRPTFWDWSMFAGTIGLFLTLIFIFMRVLPMISIAEVKGLLHEEKSGGHH